MSYQSKPEGFPEDLQPVTNPNEQAILMCKLKIQACEKRIAEIKGNSPEASRCLIGSCSQPAMGGAPFCRVHAPVVVQTAPGEAVQSPTPPGLTKGEATAREDFHDALRALVPDLVERNAAIDRILAPKAPPEPPKGREADDLASTLSDVLTYIEGKEDLRPYSALTKGKGLHTRVLFHLADISKAKPMPPNLTDALKAAEIALTIAILEDGDISAETVQDALGKALEAIWAQLIPPGARDTLPTSKEANQIVDGLLTDQYRKERASTPIEGARGTVEAGKLEDLLFEFHNEDLPELDKREAWMAEWISRITIGKEVAKPGSGDTPVSLVSPAPGPTLDAAGMASCPFCGQRGAINSLPHYKAGCWNAKCVAFVNGNMYLTEDAAVAGWNRRAQPPAPQPIPPEAGT